MIIDQNESEELFCKFVKVGWLFLLVLVLKSDVVVCGGAAQDSEILDDVWRLDLPPHPYLEGQGKAAPAPAQWLKLPARLKHSVHFHTAVLTQVRQVNLKFFIETSLHAHHPQPCPMRPQ